MNEIKRIIPSQERYAPKSSIESYARVFMNRCKAFFETKFPLETHSRNGTTVLENEIITENKGIYNILYLPFDETRKDKEEQVKIRNNKQAVTIIIQNDKDNPKISFELFELNDCQPEKRIANETNTPEAVYRASKILSELSDLSYFDLVYTAVDL